MQRAADSDVSRLSDMVNPPLGGLIDDQPIMPHSQPSESEQKYVPLAQRGAVTATEYNKSPTKVPPPIAPLTGTLGQRHVIVVIGLPFSGQIPVTHLLKHYLEFMHGSDVQLFDVNNFAKGAPDENGAAMLDAIKAFFVGERSKTAKGNLNPLIGQTFPCGTVDESDARFENVDTGAPPCSSAALLLGRPAPRPSCSLAVAQPRPCPAPACRGLT